jgi:hypothetical protein
MANAGLMIVLSSADTDRGPVTMNAQDTRKRSLTG